MGTLFGFWLLLGMGSFADALARYQRGTAPLYLFGVVGNFIGMLFFSSALTLFVYVILAFLLFIYWIVYLEPHIAKQMQFKLFLLSVTLVASGAFVLIFGFPGNPVVAKIEAALPVTVSWDALAAMKDIRTKTALDIWQGHPWMGVGADGFRHFSGLTVAGKEWGLLKADPSCVYNDCLQFLCEFGVLGSGLLLAAIITLLVPICYRARIVWKNDKQSDNSGRVFLFRLSPIVLTGVLATLVCFLESWIANPFRSYSILLSWTCVLAVLPAFLPERAPTAARGRNGG
jgi:hypothetical protein